MSIPIGCVPVYGAECGLLRFLMDTSRTIFSRNGTEVINPTLLKSKYVKSNSSVEPETTKLVYRIDNQDQFLEKLILRYDQTRPLVQFLVGCVGGKPDNYYQIGKVYRRDNPSATRRREFWQADYDIVNSTQQTVDTKSNLIYLFLLIDEFLERIQERYQLPVLTMRLNNLSKEYSVQELLDLPDERMQEVYRVMDKKGDYPLAKYMGMLRRVNLDYKTVQEACDKRAVLFQELVQEINGLVTNYRVVADPWMVRGLDYYNGYVFELSLDGKSIAGGGQYDYLDTGMWAGGAGRLRMMGFSLGLTRMMMMLEAKSLQTAREGYYLYFTNGVNWNLVRQVMRTGSKYCIDSTTKSRSTAIGKANKKRFKYLLSDGQDMSEAQSLE